jgi:hypothetical protein
MFCTEGPGALILRLSRCSDGKKEGLRKYSLRIEVKDRKGCIRLSDTFRRYWKVEHVDFQCTVLNLKVLGRLLSPLGKRYLMIAPFCGEKAYAVRQHTVVNREITVGQTLLR